MSAYEDRGAEYRETWADDEHAWHNGNGHHPDDPGPPDPQRDDDPGRIQHTAHLGIAYLLANHYKDKLLFVYGIGWHSWDGMRWVFDDGGAAKRAVFATLKQAWVAAFNLEGDARKEAVRTVKACETANGVTGVLTLAAALTEFAATVRDIDADPWLVNCANGTLDLRTMKLHTHRPIDRITKITKAAYQPSHTSSDWVKFLERILPDAEVRGYLQRLIGLSLLGEVNGDKQVAPICHGEGANGKSTFAESVCHALGDYAVAAEPTLLLAKRGDAHPTGQADLLGRRLVTTTETEQGARFDIALLKRLTGGDTIKARKMRQDFFEFKPSHLLLMMTNHKPVINDDTEAVWRRIRLIPFTVTIPEGERDAGLSQRLILQSDAIFTWAVAGWNDYQERGGLDEPAMVLLATDEYRSDSDVIGRFIADRCDISGVLPGSTTAALFKAFESWRAAEGVTEQITKKEFGRQLDRKGHPCNQTQHGWPRAGLCLRHDTEDD